MLGSRWSKDELECFYGAYRKYGKDWRKIAGAIRDRTSDMVEALYYMNKAYLSLPEGTATAAGLIAMMTDHYDILKLTPEKSCEFLYGSNSDQEINDSPKASRKPQKHGRAKFQSVSKTSDMHYADLSQSPPASSSYRPLSLLKKKRSGDLFVGNRPCAVGKRTPRVPVASICHRDDRGVPNRQAKPDANNGDDEETHLAALALAEVYKRGGSHQVSHTPGTSDGLGDKKGDARHFKTRFSVHRIRELVPDFNENQKNWITDAGVGALLSMSEFSIPVKLVQWIMRHIDPLLREFRFQNKVIVFDRPLVSKILGLENGMDPLKLSGDVENIEIFLKIRDQYREGERAKIKKCIEVLKGSNDRESFMRAFMLLALGTVYCPGTTNGVSMKYLHSLIDISQIRNYDWAGHIIEVLMDEVKKYQNFDFARLQRDHQIGSCLAILAIAYMDHLDIPTDRGAHQINYALPRICNVSNKDFEFIMNIDKSRPQLDAYGRLPFQANSPYSAPVINECLVIDEVHVVSSASSDEWMHPSGSPNQFLQQKLKQLPPEHQKIIVEYNCLLKHDIDELADAMAANFKAKSKEIRRKRCGEMMSKIIKINVHNQGNAIVSANASSSGNALSSGKETANQLVDFTSKVATSIVDENNITDKSDSPKYLEHRSKLLDYCDDVPSLDLFKDDPEGNATYGGLVVKTNEDGTSNEHSPVITPPGGTSSNDGTITREKRNRRNKASVNLNPRKKPKMFKLDKDTCITHKNI